MKLSRLMRLLAPAGLLWITSFAQSGMEIADRGKSKKIKIISEKQVGKDGASTKLNCLTGAIKPVLLNTDCQAVEIAKFDPYDLTWNRFFHVNPAFSRDGKRVYYCRPLNDKYSGTFCCEIKVE